MFMLGIISLSVKAKEVKCNTYERMAGPNGYLSVKTTVDDQFNSTTHTLNCYMPGDLPCKWDGGVSPCCPRASGIIVALPVNPDIILEDDNGNAISIEVIDINNLIISKLVDGDFSGNIMMGDELQVVYEYVLNEGEGEEGYTLRVKLLTGGDIFI